MERFSSAGEFLDFYRANLEGKLKKRSFIYGNSEAAKEALQRRDTWALFGKLDSPSYQKGRWALDALRSLEIFLEDPDTFNTYESSVEVFSAGTLYAVTRAESNGEVGTENYGFHQSIHRSLEEEEPEGEWIENIEYVGKKKDRENQAQMESVEKEITEIEQQIENKEEEINSRDQQIEQKSQEIDEIERRLDLYGTVVSNFEILANTVRDVEQIQDRLERLDQVDGAMIRDISDIDSKIEETEENLGQRVDVLEQRYGDLAEDMDQLKEDVETTRVSLEELTDSIEDFGGHTSESIENLEQLVGDLEDRVDNPTEGPVIVSEDISHKGEKGIEELDRRLERVENKVKSESQSSGIWDSISSLFPGTDKSGDQTTIDDWN